MFQLETEDNEFECVECGKSIKVAFVQEAPRPITCEECGTGYSVAKGLGEGLSVSLENNKLMSEDFNEEFDEESEEE